MTVDPLIDQTEQPYTYTADEPVNNYDLNGLYSCSPFCSTQSLVIHTGSGDFSPFQDINPLLDLGPRIQIYVPITTPACCEGYTPGAQSPSILDKRKGGRGGGNRQIPTKVEQSGARTQAE